MPYRFRIPYISSPKDIRSLLLGEGAASQELESQVGSLFVTSVLMEGLTKDLTELLQRDFIALGGHAIALPGRRGIEHAEVLLSGNLHQFERLHQVLVRATDERNKVRQDIEQLIERLKDPCPHPIVYNGKELDFSKKTYIMGTLNVTPDSFSDGGRYLNPKRAVARAMQMVEEGAEIVDVGGESTRPGSEPVPAQVQIDRILPVIEGIRKDLDIWISVDTYLSEVAKAAIGAGADIINDISGARFDPEMAPLAAETGIPIILMHIRGTPKNMQVAPSYHSLVSELLAYFMERIEEVEQAGVEREKIILDPGIGFGKTVEHNLFLLKHVSEFRVLGRPILLGTSRKSFIGSILNRDVGQRLCGSLATAVLGYWNGAHILRVHDISETKEVLMMAEATKRVEYMP